MPAKLGHGSRQASTVVLRWANHMVMASITWAARRRMTPLYGNLPQTSWIVGPVTIRDTVAICPDGPQPHDRSHYHPVPPRSSFVPGSGRCRRSRPSSVQKTSGNAVQSVRAPGQRIAAMTQPSPRIALRHG